MALKQGQVQRAVATLLKPVLSLVTILFMLQYSGLFSRSHKSGNSKISKSLIIASQRSSDLTWLAPAAKAGGWDVHTYITDGNPTALQPHTVPLNKGNEAMVYLTYIIDNYDNLPDVMFFHHHHSQAWHQAYPSSYELAHLKASSVLKQHYLPPRCLPGCENVIELSGDVMPLYDLKTASRDVLITSVLKAFLDPGEKVPEKIAAPCCAQFAVSKEAVLRRRKETWEGLRTWLMETDVLSASAGRVLEYTWHIWFGMEPVL
ncbi:hypothetical protein BP5796_07150 [Coleophoma crateriformis]|uniref:Uncharacterized protein n=1 Tax=Coleophoma crateriformis TaxID=565419 RepID=A0A3D8RIF3_9HELO|nr:hypothetical protein BP5796_07150 [Coleophoma crateriformis]